MATHAATSQPINVRVFPQSKSLRLAVLLLLPLFCCVSSRAQFQSAFVFAPDPKGVAVYTRNDITGILTPVAGSPFPSREAVNVMTLDFSGRFLFTANRNLSAGKISMFTVDPNTGALQEVSTSPFASAATNAPVFLSVESSGQFLYVINFNGSKAGASSFEIFNINSNTAMPSSSSLTPSATLPVDLPGVFVSGGTHVSGRSFYAFLNGVFSTIPNETFFLVFDGATGKFTIPNPNLGPNLGSFGCCFALDPQGHSLALGTGTVLTSYGLQADGTLAANTVTGSTGTDADSMSFDPLGRFLYVDLVQPPSNATIVHFFSVATLQEMSNSPLPSTFPSTATWNLDPTAPLIFADQVYQVDPQTGVPSSILLSSPISPPSVFSRPPGSQPVVGPIAQFNPASISFGSLTIGQASSAMTLTITSIGGQALSLNSIAITGANSSDFAITGDTCHAPVALMPNSSCSELIMFTPSAIGARSAAITLTDNASPPTQSAPLSGTGLAPAPAVTLIPGSLNFGNVTEGTSPQQSISVQNSGTATLHITSVAISGANANDYSSSSPTCTSPIAVNSSCTVIVTFTPLASGVRSATLTLTDDAPNSPQTVALNGTGVSVGPGISFSPPTPSFPTTTQGTSSSAQTLTVTNSGNSPLHISSVSLAAANSSEFTANNTCSAPVAPAANCTISIAFSPIATGQRTANLIVSDDVSGSPQIVSLGATANPAFTVGPAPGGSTTASVSAGQTAQYQLQLVPGPGYSGTVSLACSGAPQAAVCQAPSTVTIANSAASAFTVSVSTSGPAQIPPVSRRYFTPFANLRALSLLTIAILLLLIRRSLASLRSLFGRRWIPECEALATAVLLAVLAVWGCGGAGSASVTPAPPITPPPVVTPSGTSTIVVTLSATSQTGVPLQLQPIQLTLTVK